MCHRRTIACLLRKACHFNFVVDICCGVRGIRVSLVSQVIHSSLDWTAVTVSTETTETGIYFFAEEYGIGP
jgi:hypothetical protein